MIDKNYMGGKITVPQTSQKILSRHHIADIIKKASLEEVVYLLAPYGSGKSMAILAWLIDNKKNAAWLTLDKSENTPLSFWAHISAAILLLSGKHEQAANIFDDPCFNENPRMFLRETLVHVAPAIENKILVIDGFWHIQNKGLLREIKDLISNMLGCWRIIIIARTELPPLFNDFLLKKHLCLITLNKLNFYKEEVYEYFAMNGFSLSHKDLNQIYEYTDGWPVALNAIMTVSQNDTIKFNDIAKEYVISYFEDRIWSNLSEVYREFLLKTSILDKLTPSICHYVTGIADASHLLRDIYIAGLFLYKLDERDTYSYNRVFREFLIDKLNCSSINVNLLYINVGWWLYEKNESIPALICFYRARFLQGINMAFKKVKPIYIGMDEYVKTTFCLTALDVRDLKEYPGVAVRIALLHFLTNNIIEMQRIHKIVQEWLEPGLLSIPTEEYTDFYWECGWLRYVDPDEDILFNPKFDEWVNVQEYAPHLLDSDRARASTLRLPSILRGVRDFSMDINKTIKFYNINSTTHNSIRDEIDLLITDIIYAEICYERDEIDKAEKLIQKITPISKRVKYTELYFSCIVLLVKILRAKHTPDEIDTLTEALKTEIEKNNHLFLLPNFHAFELQNRLAKGIPGMTDMFENENREYLDKPYYYLIYRHITMVKALISVKKYNEATLILSNLDYLMRLYKRNMDLVEVNILRSIVEYGLGHKTEARQYISLALEDGQKCNFVRIFSDYAIFISPILKSIYKRDSNKYIEKVKASCKMELERSKLTFISKTSEHESLTSREIEILKCLQMGMKNKEIASSLNITVGTAKGYVHIVLQKLNVTSRAEAILVTMKNGIT